MVRESNREKEKKNEANRCERRREICDGSKKGMETENENRKR